MQTCLDALPQGDPGCKLSRAAVRKVDKLALVLAGHGWRIGQARGEERRDDEHHASPIGAETTRAERNKKHTRRGVRGGLGYGGDMQARLLLRDVAVAQGRESQRKAGPSGRAISHIPGLLAPVLCGRHQRARARVVEGFPPRMASARASRRGLKIAPRPLASLRSPA